VRSAITVAAVFLNGSYNGTGNLGNPKLYSLATTAQLAVKAGDLRIVLGHLTLAGPWLCRAAG
jgi:hypothetical protein